MNKINVSEKLAEIKGAVNTVRDEWMDWKYPNGGHEIFEKDSRAVILTTFPTDSNGRFDGSIIAKFPEYITFLLQLAEERNEALKTIHGIASETFESHNQLELIRLTATENADWEEQK